jgi:hypothetical protein
MVIGTKYIGNTIDEVNDGLVQVTIVAGDTDEE